MKISNKQELASMINDIRNSVYKSLQINLTVEELIGNANNMEQATTNSLFKLAEVMTENYFIYTEREMKDLFQAYQINLGDVKLLEKITLQLLESKSKTYAPLIKKKSNGWLADFTVLEEQTLKSMKKTDLLLEMNISKKIVSYCYVLNAFNRLNHYNRINGRTLISERMDIRTIEEMLKEK